MIMLKHKFSINFNCVFVQEENIDFPRLDRQPNIPVVHSSIAIDEEDKQYGFIKGRFTVLQLLRTLDDWTAMLENECQVDVVLH